MGEVWRGTDMTLNRAVAIKLVRLDPGASRTVHDQIVKRFKREAQAVAALRHPNIITAYDFGVDETTQTEYFVMELIEGRTIAAELGESIDAGRGPLPLDRVLAIGIDVCDALAVAHRAGVVHRDLKPANLMHDTLTGQLKIVDFGIAHGAELSRLTRAGGWLGSVSYTSPEQLSSADIDGRADLYSLACVLYELLTAASPYVATDVPQFLYAHLSGEPRPLRALAPSAPPALEALLREMLAKVPDDRPATAEAVAQRLRAIARDSAAARDSAIVPTGPAPSDPSGVALPAAGVATVTPTLTPAAPPFTLADPALGATPPLPPPPTTTGSTVAVPPSGDVAPTTLVAAPDVPDGEREPGEPGQPGEPGPRAAPVFGAGTALDHDGGVAPVGAGPRRRGARAAIVTAAIAGVTALALLAWWFAGAGSPAGGQGAAGHTSQPPTAATSPTGTSTTAATVVAECGHTLAFLGPLTGTSAPFGKSIRNGAELAVNRYNAVHGAGCITLRVFDTKASAPTTAAAAAAIADDATVIGVVGPGSSSEADNSVARLDAAGVPLVSASTTRPSLSSQGWHVFHRIVPTDLDVAAAAAPYILSVLHARHVYLVDDGSAYGTALTGRADQTLGAVVVGRATIAANEGTSSTVSAIIAKHADVVLFGGFGQAGGALRYDLSAAGWRGPLVGGATLLDDAFIAAAGRVAANGTIAMCNCTPVPTSGVFVDAYRQAFGTAPPSDSNLGYDAANVLLSGIAAGNRTRESLLGYVNGYDNGRYAFSANGDLAPQYVRIWVFKVRGGHFAPDQVVPTS
jgi:branched-chain amino acid transport system substrate-binding protein